MTDWPIFCHSVQVGPLVFKWVDWNAELYSYVIIPTPKAGWT